MNLKIALFSAAVLAGAAIYIVQDPSLFSKGQDAVGAMKSQTFITQLTSWVSGEAARVSGAQPVTAVHNTTHATTTTNSSKTNTTGSQPSGTATAQGQGTSTTGASNGDSAQPTGSGTTSNSVTGNSVQASVLPITTDNAPPPTPTVLDGVQMQYDPFRPSDGAYPAISGDQHVWLDVSISQQLAYLFNGNKLLYTFVTSSGIGTNADNGTPLGVYHIQGERGTWFYSQQYQMGAQYWVSWLGHGIFLFHSVPMNQDQQVLPKVAAELGHKASHGCFHLTVPDAKWVYDNIPYGTAVVVEQAPVELQGKAIYNPSADQQSAELGGLVASKS